MKLNIYFIHADGLKDRERVIDEFKKQISKYQFKNIDTATINIQIVKDYDPQDITNEIIQRTVNYSPIVEKDTIKEETQTASLTVYNQFIKNLHLFQLSNVLKHYKVLEYIANSKPDEINMVLEDDIVYEEKLSYLLDKVFASLPIDYELVFLGLPTNKQIENRNEIKYQATQEVFRILPYTDSYIISQKTAKKLYDGYLPIKFIGNIQLSYLIESLNIKTVLTQPNIFIDGSKIGAFLSVLTPNNLLLFNQEYMAIRNQLQKQEDLTDEEVTKINELIQKSPVHNHPDFMYVKAQFLTKQKKYKEAEEVYEKALAIYTANNCIVNHESLFLKEYNRLYKFLQ